MKKILAFLCLFFLISSNLAVIIKAPAVSETEAGTYKGVPITFDIEVSNGTGHVFMDTLPLTQMDMQGSARIAAKVAGEVTGKNMNKYNVYITVRSDVPFVGGPSAGGTMCVGIIADLLNLSINHRVMMTGAINPDGSIGPVGGILEKIEAAKEANCTIMLIPKGQRYIKVEGRVIDAVEFGKKLGVKVYEVGNIYEALSYFTGKKFKMKEYPENPAIEEKYKNIMKNLYLKVINRANEKYKKVSNILNTYYFGYEYQYFLTNELNKAKKLLDEANDAYLNGDYYTATSKAFNAMIILEKIDGFIQYLSGDITVRDYLLQTQKIIDKDKKLVYSKNLTTGNFEEVLAGRERIFEAENILNNAWKSYYNGDIKDAIENAAYARMRAESAVWWINLANESGKELNKNKLRVLAQQYLDNAETVYGYVVSMYPNLFTNFNDLDEAKEAYDNGDYLLSIAKSIDVCVKADIPLVMFSDINYLKKYAKNKIDMAEYYNITPLSALSYYEYANSFNDTLSKIMYYKYSSYYAQMDMDVIKSQNYKLEKLEPTYVVEENEVVEENGNIPPNISYIVLSFLSGLFIGLFGGYISRRFT
ncbi:S16 family serine protease [Methanocaldococcus indicus]|uniref:S16 family serine protease n=1 Tax=Methanocaldococcus indicus TaxID=213231 RepID=UPI003C6D98C6